MVASIFHLDPGVREKLRALAEKSGENIFVLHDEFMAKYGQNYGRYHEMRDAAALKAAAIGASAAVASAAAFMVGPVFVPVAGVATSFAAIGHAVYLANKTNVAEDGAYQELAQQIHQEMQTPGDSLSGQTSQILRDKALSVLQSGQALLRPAVLPMTAKIRALAAAAKGRLRSQAVFAGLTSQQCIDLLTKDGNLIAHMTSDQRTSDVCMAAIKQNPKAALHLELNNVTDEVADFLNDNPAAITHLSRSNDPKCIAVGEYVADFHQSRIPDLREIMAHR